MKSKSGDENFRSRRSIYDHFPQDWSDWAAICDRLFRKELTFERSISQKMTKIVRKWFEKGSEKWSRGLERSGWVKIWLRIHWKASRRPETPLQIQKRPKAIKIKKFRVFRIFQFSWCGPYREPLTPYPHPVWGLLYFSGLGPSLPIWVWIWFWRA